MDGATLGESIADLKKIPYLYLYPLNGFYSEYSTIESGVPQGSVLGPLLFLIYINDFEHNIKSNVKFFADDTMLFSIVKDPIWTSFSWPFGVHCVKT